MKPFLIYGANGYTGKLIVEEAVRKGLRPVLGGRSENKIRPLAQEFQLDHVTFALDHPSDIDLHIKNFSLVLNCAGPFSRTAIPLVEACLRASCHYIDITGEIEVFERVKTYHPSALEKQIVLMPGVGFDVVPTDCVAAHLHSRLPDATHLELGFTGIGGSISHGTMMTMVENLGSSGAIRKNGMIIKERLGREYKVIDFGKKKRFTISIPWGDISTSFHTTKIPNIRVYTAAAKSNYYLLKFQFLFNPLIRLPMVKSFVKRYVDKNVTGPSILQNQNGRSLVWGKATNAKGEAVEIRLEGPESYMLTARTAVLITEKILSGKPASGYHTPAGLFGHGLILEIEGTSFF